MFYKFNYAIVIYIITYYTLRGDGGSGGKLEDEVACRDGQGFP